MSIRYVRRKIKEASGRGKLRANRRWELDHKRRERLAKMELERRRRLVVILRDMETGEDRVLPWNEETFWRLRALVESTQYL